MLSSLRSVDLRSEVHIDPAREDAFRRVVEARVRAERRTDLTDSERERLRSALKVVANSGSYGIYGEANPETLPEGETVEVQVDAAGDHKRARVSSPEAPGEFSFLPLAALITAAARLKLALLERAITDRGGSYVACDTDSMMPVASERGGLIACDGGARSLPDGRAAIRALTWREIDEVVQAFEALKPYDHAAVPDPILKIDKVNFDKETKARLPLECYAISAKRYALFTRDPSGQPVLRDKTEGGLGHYLDPRDPRNEEDETRKAWIGDAWLRILGGALAVKVPEPEWLDRPALSRDSLTSPAIVQRMTAATASRPYADRLKPFNFVLAAHARPNGFPVGADPQHFHLLAPFTDDARQWTKLTWTNSYDGKRYRITTAHRSSATTAGVRSYRDALAAFARHPEAKSLAPDGGACTPETVGLLQRRPVFAARTIAIGKEAHRIEDVDREDVHDLDEVQTIYGDIGPDPWTAHVLPILRELPRALLAAVADISERAINSLWHERSRPSPAVRATLTTFAADHARAAIGDDTTDVNLDDETACMMAVIQLPNRTQGEVPEGVIY